MENLKDLWAKLNHLKPKGWSVVWADGAISVRPDNREVGKFVICQHFEETFTLMFFDRAKNIWTESNDFHKREDVSGDVLDWMKTVYHKVNSHDGD